MWVAETQLHQSLALIGLFRYTTVYRCPAVCSVCRPLRRCHRPLSVYQAAQDKVLPHDVSNVQCLLRPCPIDTEIHWYSVSGSNVVNHLIIFAVNRCLLTVCVESFTLDMPALTCLSVSVVLLCWKLFWYVYHDVYYTSLTTVHSVRCLSPWPLVPGPRLRHREVIRKLSLSHPEHKIFSSRAREWTNILAG